MSTESFDVEREIGAVEAAIRERPELTDEQLEDIRTLCERIRGLCESRNYEEARRTKALCMSIITRGPPAPE